jgi:apolipoprotein N-acyltransferase
MNMKRYHLLLLSVLSGVLFSFGWFPNGIFPFLFIAFVPLLMIEDHCYKNKIRPVSLFGYTYLSFFIWNILTTWWVKNASFGGAAMAIVCNALLMSFAFLLSHQTKKRTGEKWSSVIFVCFWLAFEFFHTNWDLSWPWLTLGNSFADFPSLIQWYEYTGVFGGSFWILLINVLVFNFILNFKKDRPENEKKKFVNRGLIIISSAIVLPVLLSFLILVSTKINTADIPVVIVQPNIDPYNEKFDAPFEEQLEKMLTLAENKVNASTQYLIFPETALTEDIWENQFDESGSIRVLRKFLKKYPALKIIVGASTDKLYGPGEELSASARKFTQEEGYYDSFNTALQLDSTKNIQIYHKSKLVPGVEQMPFPFIFKHLESIAIDLGGTTGQLGTQKERTVFFSKDHKMATAPVVCYESIYGEYVGEYIRNGANFISIITNDGWWADTPGYRQHLRYGRLRAIETRRWIARSANTGISCFIDPKGAILQPTGWWVPAVISQNIGLNDNLTFYTKYGDYIARAAVCIAWAMLIYSLFLRFKIAKK